VAKEDDRNYSNRESEIILTIYVAPRVKRLIIRQVPIKDPRRVPPRPDVDSLITVLGNGLRRSVRDRGPMKLNPDAVEKPNELAVKESANQASGET
jgi:hypothetical protein